MDIRNEVLAILDERLLLNGRSATFTDEWPLLATLPGMDSMVVVAIIASLEERFGITVEDDDISGDTFHNLGSLTDFVSEKLGVPGVRA